MKRKMMYGGDVIFFCRSVKQDLTVEKGQNLKDLIILIVFPNMTPKEVFCMLMNEAKNKYDCCSGSKF